jgi:glycosyltransferase involved in cell wall biosynthesis
MKRAPVSVVIPSYNSARYIVETIDSILAQTVQPAEIIVVDDGSTDESAQILAARYDGRIRYIYQENAGVSAARNRGIEAANGDFIAFCDADDIWHPQKLEFQMDAFARIPAAGLVGTKGYILPGAGAGADAVARYDGLPENVCHFVTWPQLVVKNYICNSSVVVRSSILNIAGDFDTNMQGPEDHDLWVRIAEISTVVNIQYRMTGYRMVPGSVSRQPKRCHNGMIRVLEKLDERKAWKGHWLLRRKAYSYVEHTCGFLYSAAGDLRTALKQSLRAFVTYPLPYRRREVNTHFERPKRLFMIVLRILRIKSPDPHTTALRRALEAKDAEAADIFNSDLNGHATPSA